MNYIPNAMSVAALNTANFSLPMFTNGQVAVNFNLGVAAGHKFCAPRSTLTCRHARLAVLL